MSTAQDEVVRRRQVQELLAALLERKLASLVRQDELGEASFAGGLWAFERMLSLCHDLNASNLELVPHSSLDSVLAYLTAAKAIMEQASDFKIGQGGNPIQTRDNIVQGAIDVYDRHFPAIVPILNFLAGKRTDFSAYIEEARTEIASLRQFTQEQKQQQAATTAEIKETLNAVKTAAAEVGVGQQSVAFKNQAEGHAAVATRWLVAAGVSVAAAVVFTLYSFHWSDFEVPASLKEFPTIALIRYALARLVVLSMLIYAVTFCARMYSANRHNEVVNRHRQNALQTFETFIKASKDEHSKDAVLLETTRSIFAIQPSGYLRDEPPPPASSTIVEVMKKITQGGSHQ